MQTWNPLLRIYLIQEKSAHPFDQLVRSLSIARQHEKHLELLLFTPVRGLTEDGK